MSFYQEVNFLTVFSQSKMVINIFFSIWPWPGFRLNSCVDAVSFPSSNRNSRIYSELLLVTLSCHPFAVTVMVIPQKDHYILLGHEGSGCCFIPSRTNRRYTTLKLLECLRKYFWMNKQLGSSSGSIFKTNHGILYWTVQNSGTISSWKESCTLTIQQLSA